MKQSKTQKRWRRRLRRVVYGGTTRLLKPAAPEPPSDLAHPDSRPDLAEDGVLRLDKSKHLPTALAEASDRGEDGWMPGRLVVIITILALVFIAVITRFVARMPAK